MPLHDAVGINCKKGATTENQGAGVQYMAGLPLKFGNRVQGQETKYQGHNFNVFSCDIGDKLHSIF